MEYKNSIKSRIMSLLTVDNEGQLLFPGDFLQIGSPEAVNMTFSRLAREKKIHRLAKGIYLQPRTHSKLGVIYPSLEEIARQIATREKVKIRPTGSYALNKLGLSTQVPTKVVFLTDGSSRKIRVGKGTITFKSTTPKKMAARGELTFLAIQAMLTLGEQGVDEKVTNHLVSVLKHEGATQVREGAKSAPVWIARQLYLIADKIEQYDQVS
jgi:RNA-binding protein YhbY